jgi:CRP-like cAMP-binding protein
MAAMKVIGSVVSVPRGAPIYSEGDRADGWFKLVDGAACTSTLLADGRRQIAAFILPGQLFGFDAPSEHHFSAESLTRTTLLRYPRSAIERLADSDLQVGRQLRALAYERLCAAHGRLLLLGRKSAHERLATFLIEMRDHAPNPDLIDLPMSRGDIGDYLGLNLETVSRAFSAFRQRGAISLPSPCTVRVLDDDALEVLASGDGDK